MSDDMIFSAETSAVMPTYGRLDLWFERGEGVWLYDKKG